MRICKAENPESFRLTQFRKINVDTETNYSWLYIFECHCIK